MHIVFASSEVVPFSKTGGLADVAGALPRTVHELGHSISVITPAYGSTKRSFDLQEAGLGLSVRIGKKQVSGSVLRSALPDSDIPVFFVQQPEYFDRSGLYDEDGEAYQDNCERFVFFDQAVLQVASQLGKPIDVIHCNDWHTGLLPCYLSETYRSDPQLRNAASLFTIHNLAYQGNFWHWDMELTGLDWSLFNWQQLEFHGHLNWMKAGIVYADGVTTVSRKYAEEIQSPEFGCGLESVIRSRSEDLSGIPNGIDTTVWNPRTDHRIAARYGIDDVETGKAVCKSSLQAEQELPVRDDVPVVSMIARLDDQKGIDLVLAAAEELFRRDLQMIILGTGKPRYHDMLTELSNRYRDRLKVRLAFSNSMAHRIEAGSDMFLMPSRYEPCGLNQLISLKYGTVPIVRATGGLVDTVVDCTIGSFESRSATGFAFTDYTAHALVGCVDRAIDLWRQRDLWYRLVRTGMQQDWSWRRSAEHYVSLYDRIRRRHIG